MTKRISQPALQRPPASVVRELLQTVREVGGDTFAIVKRAGLAQDADALLDASWEGPLSREQFACLYRECTAALTDHAARLEGRAPMTKAEVDMLCYCVITCATLEQAIERAAAFCAMLDRRAGALSISTVGALAHFRMRTFHEKRNVSAFLADLCGLSTYHRLFGWLIGEDIELVEVRVCYAPLLDEQVVARLMPHPITYAVEDNLLRFSAKYLQRPVVRSYAELVRLLERFPFDLEEPQSKLAPISERVRVILGTALAQRAPLPTTAQLAEQFSISAATLKRRLAEEGTSLLQLKERCRRELALDMLRDDTLSFGAIAFRLGFSDSTTFSRAFKQWTGQSPSACRRAHVRRVQPSAVPHRSS